MFLQSWDNTDFVVGYGVWRDHLTATVHAEPPTPGLPDQRGTFALSITPPGPEQCVAFPRSVVFLFDRSGSMTGERCDQNIHSVHITWDAPQQWLSSHIEIRVNHLCTGLSIR